MCAERERKGTAGLDDGDTVREDSGAFGVSERVGAGGRGGVDAGQGAGRRDGRVSAKQRRLFVCLFVLFVCLFWLFVLRCLLLSRRQVRGELGGGGGAAAPARASLSLLQRRGALRRRRLAGGAAHRPRTRGRPVAQVKHSCSRRDAM
jgi:hypothetical protein